MRIAIIGNSAHTLLRFRFDLMVELRQLGYEVFAFSPDYHSNDLSKLERIGVKAISISINRTSINPFTEIKTIIDIHAKLKESKIDITLSYFLKPSIYGSIAASIYGIRRIYSMLAGLGYAFTETASGVFTKKYIIKSIMKLPIRYALKKNNKVFFQNKDDEHEFVTSKLVNKHKSYVVNGSGVNLELFSQTEPITDKVVFVTSGRLLVEKGIIEYLQAASRIKKNHTNVKFILLGDFDQNPSSLKIDDIQSFIDNDVVEWPGQVDNVKEYLTNSSVFVLASYREGTPRSTLEALATGRAVITTDVPGCRETVIEGVNGFFVPPRDPEKLAEVMERFILNPELIRSMGVESRRLAEEKFDVRKVNRKMMEEMGLLSDESMISA